MNENSEPFGNSTPDSNPSGLGAFTYNLRFPGQYADAETGTSYNYFRDYDPTTGRYRQSDPIGLKGGLNTFAYSRASPLRYVDATGLVSVGGPVDTTINTIMCDGDGGMEPSIWPWQEPCIVECTREHEMVHIADALKENPRVCANKARGLQIYFTVLTVDATECRASKASRACAIRKLLEQKCEGGCREALRSYLDHHETQIVERCIMPNTPLPR